MTAPHKSQTFAINKQPRGGINVLHFDWFHGKQWNLDGVNKILILLHTTTEIEKF